MKISALQLQRCSSIPVNSPSSISTAVARPFALLTPQYLFKHETVPAGERNGRGHPGDPHGLIAPPFTPHQEPA